MTLCSSLPSLCRLTCVGILKNAVIAGLLYAPVTEFLSTCTLVSLLKLFQLLFPSFCVSVALLVFSHVTFAV